MTNDLSDDINVSDVCSGRNSGTAEQNDSNGSSK
jgi:hypothetical protein